MQRPVEQVSDGMVPLDGGAAGGVEAELDFGTDRRSPIAGNDMKPHIARFLRSGHRPKLSAVVQFSGVPDLPAHFRVASAGV